MASDRTSTPDRPTDWIDVDKLLACIHCGLCLPSCPTHVISGEEMPSPRGRLYLMRAVAEGRLEMSDSAFAEHEWSCLVCRACETACPSGVEFGHLMEQTRAELTNTKRSSIARRLIYTRLLRSTFAVKATQTMLASLTALHLTPALHGLGKMLRHVSPRLSAMMRLAPSTTPFPKRRKRSASASSRGTVALIVGCIGDAFTSEINDATIRILTWLDYEVIPITSGVCCGALASHAGYHEQASRMAEEIVRAVMSHRPDVIVSNIAGCGAMLKDYEGLLPDSAMLREFNAKVRDINEFLVERDLDRVGSLSSPQFVRIRYQSPCHLVHAQKVVEEPWKLISRVGNVAVEPLAENELCCGSAGAYNIEHSAEAEVLLERKMSHIASAAPDLVLTANAGCFLQLKKGTREEHIDVPVKHIVEWLASLLPTERSTATLPH